MPIFEYQCRACQDEFELLIRGSESDAACPICGSLEVKKKFSTFGFRSGETPHAHGGSSCGGCSSGNCSGCHH